MIRTLASLGIVIACASVGCRSARAADIGMPDSTFVNTMGDLRRLLTDTSLDATMKDSTRRMVLRRHKVTSAGLENAARVLAKSPTRASDLWRQIESLPLPSAPRPVPPPHPPGRNPPAARP